jgi:hypothetical protein
MHEIEVSAYSLSYALPDKPVAGVIADSSSSSSCLNLWWLLDKHSKHSKHAQAG